MANCDVQTLLSDGREFGALPPGDQMTAELALLARWAGYSGTVQQLLEDGRCFGQVCTQAGDQMTAQLQLLCQIAAAGPGPLVVSYTSVDASVVSGVPQADGSVTITVSGGTGPYTVHSANGYPDQTGAGPDFVFAGLSGSATYSFWVQDSAGQVYPVDYPVSTIDVYVFTSAYSWHAAYSSTLALVAGFPNNRALTIPKFDPSDPIYSNGTLTGVVFELANTFRSSLTVINNLGSSQTVQVTVSDASHFFVEGSNRVNDTITLATFGPTLLGIGQTQVYVRRSGSSDTTSSEDTSPSTLAAVSGSGNLNASFISDAIVNTIVQGLSLGISNGADAGCTATVTYNYSVPRQ